MENTQGLSPLQSIPPEKNCIEDFGTLAELYSDIALHLFFSPAAAQSVKGDEGVKGDTGETGPQGNDGEQGLKGDDGDDAYQVWLKTQSDQTQTEEEFIEDITGPEGPAPTVTQISKVSIGNGAALMDIKGDFLSIFHLEYDDGSPPTLMVPASTTAITSIVDLKNGYVRCHLAPVTGDDKFKLVSSGFMEAV